MSKTYAGVVAADPDSRSAQRERRAAATREAKLSQIEALASGAADELEAVTLMRVGSDVQVLTFGSSSFMRLSRSDNPLPPEHIAAAIRLQEAFFVGARGSSNAAKIERWLQQSLSATQKDREAKAFGHVMNVGDDSGVRIDPHAAMFEAAHMLGWLSKNMNRVSWALLDLSVRLEFSASEIAAKTDQNLNYITSRLREALAELYCEMKNYDRGGRFQTGMEN